MKIQIGALTRKILITCRPVMASMIKNIFRSGINGSQTIISLTLILFLICGSALAATITVQPGESIQEAIDQARNGDVIEVVSGTYEESVDVNKPLAIIGIDSGKGMPIIDAGSEYGPVHLTADGCQVIGFRILHTHGHGIDMNSDHNRIANNTIEACGAGIFLSQSDGNVLSNNDVKISCKGWMGLLPSDGIQLMDSFDNIIEGNRATSSWIGIYLMNSRNNTVRKNIAYENEHGIALMSSSNNSILENDARNNQEEGIGLLDSCSGNMIAENTAEGNSIGIDILDSNNDNDIYHNNFIKNTQNARSADSKNSWHYPESISNNSGDGIPSGPRGNYWSDYDGVDLNGDGVGDTVHSFEYEQDNYPLMDPWTDL